jgi:group I intron endonuclease
MKCKRGPIAGIYVHILVLSTTEVWVYVGQSWDIDTRHAGDWTKKGYGKCPKFLNAIKKYGQDTFQTLILEKVPQPVGVKETPEEQAVLDALEIKWIAYWKLHANVYNLAMGGSNGKHSEESKQKISEAKRGKPSWNSGKPMSDDHRRKISEANLGKPKNEDHLRKIGESRRGRPWSPARRAAYESSVATADALTPAHTPC